MELIEILFGHGKDLNVLQMCCRSLVVFIICLILIRVSGRRSFGLRTPLDNIIVILLGALLSRPVVGASPFIPVIAASLILVLLHRVLAWWTMTSYKVQKLVEGDKICLYKNGRFIDNKLKDALVCKEDVLQGVRKPALTEDISKIEVIYMERNGEISPIKKD
jgi:uncharacterized membrane protein YcaP (DUF421 family)